MTLKLAVHGSISQVLAFSSALRTSVVRNRWLPGLSAYRYHWITPTFD
jgi:hypothetical protein